MNLEPVSIGPINGGLIAIDGHLAIDGTMISYSNGAAQVGLLLMAECCIDDNFSSSATSH